MKKSFVFGFFLIAFTTFLSSCSGSYSAAGNYGNDYGDGTVSYQVFYDNLSPYGTWIDYPEYGHVWNPNVNGDFRPYATNGHWASSDDGWTWVSNYNWGWAPFHYGRWLYDDFYGWLWIPGYDWSPAWVTWGYIDDYYCWAPLMPGINARERFNSWRPNSFYWNVCNRNRIYDQNLSGALVRPERLSNFQNRVAVINNFNNSNRANHLYYSKGPDVQEVQKHVNRRIEQNTVRDVNRINDVKHNGNNMNVYRPNIQNPAETARQHPQQLNQPREFRRAGTNRPINKPEQRPMMQRSEQRTNIQRLPMQRSQNYPSRSNRGNNRH
ncbi:DUF6600 domain-containing protein [Flavobacterium sp. W1B]|uniref:DUF6600 domain-containing protein n=1 Tax=Flavobacterium sp. W1B TaxID=3394146 RepID=UPI0039BCA07E